MPAGAAVGPGVEVVGPDGSGTVSEAQIKAGALPSTTYLLRATPGEVGREIALRGMPVQEVIEEAGVPFDGSGYLTIPRPKGTVAYLPGEDFLESSRAFEGGKPAVISIDGPSTRFFRPLFENEPDGVNAEYNIATPAGEALRVGVHGGNVLTVQASASTSSTAAGSPVQFTAAATGGVENETFTYSWTFGDGTTAAGASVPHTFSGSGTYVVRATATGSEESGGESGPVPIVVGNPPTTEAPGAATTPQPQAKAPQGAPGKGPKPTVTGGKGKENAAGSPPTQRGGSPPDASHPTNRSRSYSAPPAPATSAPVPLPEARPTVPPPTSVEPSGGDLAEPPGCCSAKSPPDGSPSKSRSQGELIEGRLVGDYLDPATVEEAAGGPSAGQGSRSAPGAVGSAGVGVPALALIVVALLAGGALHEWRRSRPIR